jgi:hypothetical protein
LIKLNDHFLFPIYFIVFYCIFTIYIHVVVGIFEQAFFNDFSSIVQLLLASEICTIEKEITATSQTTILPPSSNNSSSTAKTSVSNSIFNTSSKPGRDSASASGLFTSSSSSATASARSAQPPKPGAQSSVTGNSSGLSNATSSSLPVGARRRVLFAEILVVQEVFADWMNSFISKYAESSAKVERVEHTNYSNSNSTSIEVAAKSMDLSAVKHLNERSSNFVDYLSRCLNPTAVFSINRNLVEVDKSSHAFLHDYGLVSDALIDSLINMCRLISSSPADFLRSLGLIEAVIVRGSNTQTERKITRSFIFDNNRDIVNKLFALSEITLFSSVTSKTLKSGGLNRRALCLSNIPSFSPGHCYNNSMFHADSDYGIQMSAKLDNADEGSTLAATGRHLAKSKASRWSNYQGVYWHETNNEWMAEIYINRQMQNLGYFLSEVEAAKAYDVAVIEKGLEASKGLNFPSSLEKSSDQTPVLEYADDDSMAALANSGISSYSSMNMEDCKDTVSDADNSIINSLPAKAEDLMVVSVAEESKKRGRPKGAKNLTNRKVEVIPVKIANVDKVVNAPNDGAAFRSSADVDKMDKIPVKVTSRTEFRPKLAHEKIYWKVLCILF